MVNEARRAEVERMLKKSRETESKRKFWSWLPDLKSLGWKAPIAIGVAIVAVIYFYYSRP